LAVRQGPVLGDLKGRVNAEWVAAFLADPQKVKAGTMMPGLFEGLDEKEKAVQVEAVTHYLMSLRPTGKAAKPKVPKHANAERGSAVFHQVGCVACHAPTADFHPAVGAPKAEEFTSRPVPLPELKAKYSVLSLAAFLEAPDKVRPDGRMPHLGLSNEDAMDIACHLMDFRPSDPREAAGLKAFAVEAAFSGLLVLVYQNACAHKQRSEPNSYFGLAVGFAVLAGGAAVSPISGGCFNPAIGMGIDFATFSADPQTFQDIWLYWGAPFAGALLATAFAKLMNAVDKRTVAFPGWLCRCRCLCCREPAAGGGGGGALRYAGYDAAYAAAGDAAAPAGDDGHVPLIVPLAEFVGTFFLVFTSSMAQEPLAVGGVLLALVYTLDHVCGADFNPAVTLAVALRLGRLLKDRGKIAVIVLAQMGGGFAAAFLAYVVSQAVNYPSPSGARGSDGAVFFECLWTAALVLTVLTVMTEVSDAEEEAEMADAAAMYTRSGHSKSYHGIAIGLVVTAGIYSASSGGAGGGGVFNPAIGVPVVVVNSFLAGKDIVPAWICEWWLGSLVMVCVWGGSPRQGQTTRSHARPHAYSPTFPRRRGWALWRRGAGRVRVRAAAHHARARGHGGAAGGGRVRRAPALLLALRRPRE